MATKLPVWANNDLATYSAFMGLPADLISAAPKKIDPQSLEAKGNPKGMRFVPGGNETDPGTYTVPIDTPAGWDPTVQLYANYNSQGNLVNFSGSNPVFPADASGKLSKLKYAPIWDASGSSVSVQDTSHGGWEGTPIVLAAASMVPGVAPFMAAANVANAIANHQPLSPSTLISLGISAIGAMGGTPVDMIPNADGTVTTYYSDGTNAISTPQQGIASPSLTTNLKTAQKVYNTSTALSKGNISSLINSLNGLIEVSPDVSIALKATNAIRALSAGMPASAIAPYITSIIDTGDPQAVNMATKILNTLLPNTVKSPTVNVDSTKVANAVSQDNFTADNTVVNNTIADNTKVDNLIPTILNGTTTVKPNTTTSKPTVNVDSTKVPAVKTSTNPLEIPLPELLALQTGKIKELDLDKLFDVVNSSPNVYENTTINARKGGSINDLLHILKG
jgi:hypothetical protein